MWVVPKYSWIVLVLPFITAIGLIIASILTPQGTMTDTGFSVKMVYFIVGAAFILFPVLGYFFVISFYSNINERERKLIQNGIKGTAEIIRRNQTGFYLNDVPQVKFLLRITIPGRQPYRITHNDYVNILELDAINVGAELPVFVDPDNNHNILLDYSIAEDSL